MESANKGLCSARKMTYQEWSNKFFAGLLASPSCESPLFWWANESEIKTKNLHKWLQWLKNELTTGMTSFLLPNMIMDTPYCRDSADGIHQNPCLATANMMSVRNQRKYNTRVQSEGRQNTYNNNTERITVVVVWSWCRWCLSDVMLFFERSC